MSNLISIYIIVFLLVTLPALCLPAGGRFQQKMAAASCILSGLPIIAYLTV